MKRTRITIEAWGDTNADADYLATEILFEAKSVCWTAKEYRLSKDYGTATAKVEQVETPDCDGGI